MEIIKLSATESTNSYIKALMAATDLGDFTVVTTKEQTKGRGQTDATWESEPGKNLTFSILKRHVGLEAHHHFLISMCVSYALYNVLSGLGVPRLSIKWPNDILSGALKICGILIENSISGHKIRTSVIGIGLNVNQITFLNQPKASSMKLLLGKDIHLEVLLHAVLDELRLFLAQLDSANCDAMRKNYEDNLFKKDIPATFQEPGGALFMGIIKGVTNEGKLKIALESDTIKEYGLREVKMQY